MQLQRRAFPLFYLFALALLLLQTTPTTSAAGSRAKKDKKPFAKRRGLAEQEGPFLQPTTSTGPATSPAVPTNPVAEVSGELPLPVPGLDVVGDLAQVATNAAVEGGQAVEDTLEGTLADAEDKVKEIATGTGTTSATPTTPSNPSTTTTTTTTPAVPPLVVVPPVVVPTLPTVATPLFQKLVTVITPTVKDGVETLHEGTQATTTTVTINSLEPPTPLLQSVLNVEEAYKQCLGARLGTEAVANLTLSALVPDAHRRLQALAPEDPSCAVMRPFMLVINQTLGLEALGGLISQPLVDHNISNFRAMGAGTSGCFIVPLNRCSAEELLMDARIAVAVPVEAAMKKPLHFAEGLNSTIAAIQDATTQAAAGVAAQVDKLLDTASAANLSSISVAPGFSFPGSESDFATIPDVADIIKNSALGGGQGAVPPTHQMPKSISMHVTLVDATGIEEKIAAWKEELLADGVDVSEVTFSVTDEVPTLAAEMAEEVGAAAAEALLQQEEEEEDRGNRLLEENAASFLVPHASTKYLVVKNVPPTAAAVVSEFLTTRPVVDFVELTPRLLFMTRWARGVTQSADWQSTPLSTSLGLDGKGQIIGMADTGIDPKVCFMSDSNSVPYNSISVNHRKLVTYITFADRLENTEKQGDTNSIGHGTHVASTLVGNSRASAASALNNGMAPNSKVGGWVGWVGWGWVGRWCISFLSSLFCVFSMYLPIFPQLTHSPPYPTNKQVAFFDIARYDGAGNIQLYPPGDLNSDLFERLYNAGARVMSMSWGSPDSNCYSSYAVMVDEFLYTYPDALIIFAAGNSGIQGDYSVVTPSTAKSCVTVGASYNVQQTSFGLENNINYVAYFSSAGPTADGRLKPDLVAPGYYITAAKVLTHPRTHPSILPQ